MKRLQRVPGFAALIAAAITVALLASRGDQLEVIPQARAQFTAGQVLNAAALNAALASPTIIGGSINGAAIGGVTPSSGAFTTLRVNGIPVGIATGLTSSLGGSSLSAGTCTSGTVAVAGASTAMVVVVTPQTAPGDPIYWKGVVTSSGTVTVKVCSVTTATPTATAYQVRVIQ